MTGKPDVLRDIKTTPILVTKHNHGHITRNEQEEAAGEARKLRDAGHGGSFPMVGVTGPGQAEKGKETVEKAAGAEFKDRS